MPALIEMERIDLVNHLKELMVADSWWDAYRVASAAHDDQTRDDGTPFIVHPLRTAIRVAKQYPNNHEVHDLVRVALVHDVIEDAAPEFWPEAYEVVGIQYAPVLSALTKADHEPGYEYAERIRIAGLPAIAVKLEDRRDNLFDMTSWSPGRRGRYLALTALDILPIAGRVVQDRLNFEGSDMRQEVARAARSLGVNVRSLAQKLYE